MRGSPDASVTRSGDSAGVEGTAVIFQKQLRHRDFGRPPWGDAGERWPILVPASSPTGVASSQPVRPGATA